MAGRKNLITKGEILDRLSILILRAVHDKTPKELTVFLSEFNPKDAEILVGLLEVNKKIWNLESEIRIGKEGKLGLKEIGRRALLIRNLNKKRVVLKGETKINHASQ